MFVFLKSYRYYIVLFFLVGNIKIQLCVNIRNILVGVRLHTCVCMCVLCVGIHACGRQRLVMSFSLYHVSVFLSGDWVSQQFPDWSRQAGHTRSTAPPYWVSDPGLPGFPVDAGESELWFSYLHSARLALWAVSPAPGSKLFVWFFYVFFIFITALRRRCDLSFSITVEENFSWEEKNKCVLEVWC